MHIVADSCSSPPRTAGCDVAVNHITVARVGCANFSVEVVFLQFGVLLGAISMYLPTIRPNHISYQADAPFCEA